MKLRSLCLCLLVCATAATPARNQAKKTVSSEADLPRFSFPLDQPASQLLSAKDAAFAPFAKQVGAAVESVLSGYSITDKQTLRDLLFAKAQLEILDGNAKDALALLDQVRDLQEKPAAKLTSGLSLRSIAQACQDTGSLGGPAFEQAFQKHFSEAINPLSWAPVQDTVKSMRSNYEIMSPDLLAANVKQDLDPQVAKTGGLDLPSAEELVNIRVVGEIQLPLAKIALAVLEPYITAHSVKKPDIWAARDVTLAQSDKLHPVRIAIFDSGVDTSLYPNQLFVDPNPDGHGPHGLAFDTQGNLFAGDLQPLTDEQKATYPKFLSLSQGLDDLRNGIDSEDAAATRKTLSTMPADQLAPFLKTVDFLGQYAHGTHVAGIAVHGNPAAQLVVVQFNDGLADLPFEPTVAWAEKFKADFQQVGDYLRSHDVRVVNMSWGDYVSEFEQWLDKTSSEKDAEKRKQMASAIYDVWREGVDDAIKAAPNTLWICAAGNSDSNASFVGDVPASLEEPNLIAVGAVDQAGDETSFTSYGKTVVLDANGYEVESYLPGGTKMRWSGTSMASPNVANLAAKLIALDPKLPPEQTIALMKESATTSADGRLHLIDPRKTIERLKEDMARK
ncbi:MAG: S8 family serine peptidase [Terracidiphilus sp.]|jgi:subtilisin family serine protease